MMARCVAYCSLVSTWRALRSASFFNRRARSVGSPRSFDQGIGRAATSPARFFKPSSTRSRIVSSQATRSPTTMAPPVRAAGAPGPPEGGIAGPARGGIAPALGGRCRRAGARRLRPLAVAPAGGSRRRQPGERRVEMIADIEHHMIDEAAEAVIVRLVIGDGGVNVLAIAVARDAASLVDADAVAMSDDEGRDRLAVELEQHVAFDRVADAAEHRRHDLEAVADQDPLAL